MDDPEDLRPALQRRAERRMSGLTPAAREALLVKCWMSHDARWFTAVAREYGMGVANRLNRAAAHELGRAEVQRVARALDWLAVTTVDEWLVLQEALIRLLGPDLLDFGVCRAGADAYQMRVRRCFAHDNAGRAGIADEYECGVFARVTGWLEGLGLGHEIDPPLGRCLKARGRECVYTLALRR